MARSLVPIDNLPPAIPRMPGSVPATQKTVEERVLDLLSGGCFRTSELMDQAGRKGLSAADVREAVWSLLDEGRLDLTPDRRLIVP